jgi:heptosyltransferase II
MNDTGTKTLIIKLGACGDVVRTTPLLHVIEGDIHWLTSGYNSTILPGNCSHLTNVFTLEKDISAISKHQYDLVLSLDEQTDIAGILPLLKYKRLNGVCKNKASIGYTAEASDWFDMSLISVLGRQQADLLKYKNRKSYQELIFKIAGKPFNAQPYWINLPAAHKNDFTVGIEKRAGDRWPGKMWWGYDILAAQLEERGYKIHFFSQRDTLQEYIKEIGACNYIISGDTLAMHIALAYGLPVLSIFTCTAPWEIYDYGLLHKVVSPFLKESFYKTEPVHAAIEAITIEMVLEAFLQMAGRPF